MEKHSFTNISWLYNFLGGGGGGGVDKSPRLSPVRKNITVAIKRLSKGRQPRTQTEIEPGTHVYKAYGLFFTLWSGKYNN